MSIESLISFVSLLYHKKNDSNSNASNAHSNTGTEEWGQIFILEALADYEPKNTREADSIVERVIPRLKHANSAVVLSAIKVLMRYVDKALGERCDLDEKDGSTDRVTHVSRSRRVSRDSVCDLCETTRI